MHTLILKMYGSHVSQSREITEIYENKKQTENEKRNKEEWRNALQRSIRRQFPDLRLVLAGSSGCGLATQGSDCDFTLIKLSSPYMNGLSVLRDIRRIVESEEARNRLDTELVSTAVVPILILKDHGRGLEGDISYNAVNTIYSTFLMRCYGNMDTRVRPLVITIKTWAKNVDIMNARYHKLSGFAVVLLIFHYLQYGCSPPVLPSLQQKYPSYFSSRDPSLVADWLEQDYTPPDVSSYESPNSDSLEVLLKGFFRYYSNFNWNQVISVRTGSFIPLPWGNKKWTKPYIRIEDPYHLTNVTRAVYQIYPFEKIKTAITTALKRVDRFERIGKIVS